MKILYEEKQSLPKLLIPAIMIPTLVIWAIGLIQLTTNKPIGNHPMSDSDMLVLLIGFGLLLPILILTARGKITVSDENMILSLRPFFRKKIALSDIEQIEAIPVNLLSELQSWGVKYRQGNWRFVLQGNQALEIRLVNGQKIVLTCRHPEELLQVLNGGKLHKSE